MCMLVRGGGTQTQIQEVRNSMEPVMWTIRKDVWNNMLQGIIPTLDTNYFKTQRDYVYVSICLSTQWDFWWNKSQLLYSFR